MIEREQLAGALARLQPRDREVLDYSLRRRVPDADLGPVFGVGPADVARNRASAVEHLSNELGVQRGEDLGQVLKLLLEPATWELLPPADAAKPDEGHRPVGAVEDAPSPHATQPPGPPPELEEGHEPVLGMLAGSTGGDEEDVGQRHRGRRVLAGVAVAIAVLAPAGVVAALTDDDKDSPTADVNGSDGPKPFKPQREAVGDPFPSDPKSANRYPIALVRRSVKLLDAPGGKLKVRVGRRTEFDSPRVFGVVKRRGDWLAVLVPELKNGEVAWIRQDRVSDLGTVPWSLHVDLSRRKLVVRRDGKKVRSVTIGVGRTDHPTPVGRFAVTDKLRVTNPGSPYGCCVLALTGHQTKLPPGWPGGDRLAVHATADTGGLGKAVSLGCMRSHPRDARWMLKRIPLGTPVFIRS